ncbi:VOC family protein [Nocardia sp. NPDC049220]|uniref:VOC family protein n=1 Tax=Nocardia sp. NPDC049220 TaxID=3155273 RepID=UPI0033D5F3CB
MIRWIWAFLARPAQRFDDCAFWSTVTATQPSARRGAHDEFVTVMPHPALFAEAGVKTQAVTGLGGVHLDGGRRRHPSAVRAALDLDAELVANHPDYAVPHSPVGQMFGLTPSGRAKSMPAPAARTPDGAMSRVDRVCLAIGLTDYVAETSCWKSLTGWEFRHGRSPSAGCVPRSSYRPTAAAMRRRWPLDQRARRCVRGRYRRHRRLAPIARRDFLMRRREQSIVLSDPGDVRYRVTARDPTGSDSGRPHPDQRQHALLAPR